MTSKKRGFVPQDDPFVDNALDSIFGDTNVVVTNLTVERNGSHHLTIETPEGTRVTLPTTTSNQTARIIGHIEENKSRRR